MDRRRIFPEYSEESNMKHRRGITSDLPKSSHVENEKRVRREIANCNERRRMQSINAGFENLRILLPPTQDGEKLSKASILQQTAKLVNGLLVKVNVLEQELAVYRRSAGAPPSSVLADITEEIATGFTRKRRTEAQSNAEHLKATKSDSEATLIGHDDGNISGRSSECYDGTFGCSPSSITRLPPVSSTLSPESTVDTAARLEHLVMAIEQIEGPPANTPLQPIGKASSLNDSFTYVSHGQSVYYKFPDSVSHLRSFSYGLNTADSSVLQQNINTFAEEFELHSKSSVTAIPVCEEKGIKEMSMNGYHHVSKLLNRPIPYKYLHRPQVVVNNSH